MHRSYRVGRRAFLGSVAGALGFKLILNNLEAAAEEIKPPPRFLLMFWPVGTIEYLFLPQGLGVAGEPFVASPILQPFDDAGLHDDTTVLYGLNHPFTCPGGGGSESGVVFASTGANSPGTRQNGGEGDDACAGGPSFDQIFLKRVPKLSEDGRGYVNVICDARVDSYETSARCLSYSYETRQIESYNPGGLITEHTPLIPNLSPLDAYTRVFGSLAPEVPPNRLATDLQCKRSVLDHTRRELARLRQLAPLEQRDKLDQHEEIVRSMEQEVAAALNSSDAACIFPEAPSADIMGQEGSGFDYGNPVHGLSRRDDLVHEQVGALHMSVIRAAFQCDLLRVATFQWAPSTGHVGFYNLHAGYPEKTVLHHPISHSVVNPSLVRSQPTTQSERDTIEFLANVHTWYNTRTAAFLAAFKSSKDVYGGSLLDHTVVPFVTDTAHFSHTRSPLPCLLFGGRALGMQGGQFINFGSSKRSHNAMWMSVAQAYLGADPLPHFQEDVFDQTDVEPIEGLWRQV